MWQYRCLSDTFCFGFRKHTKHLYSMQMKKRKFIYFFGGDWFRPCLGIQKFLQFQLHSQLSMAFILYPNLLPRCFLIPYIARWTHSIPTNEIIDVTCKIILVHIIKVCRIVCRGRMLKDFFPFLLLQTRYQNNLFFADFKLWCSLSV